MQKRLKTSVITRQNVIEKKVDSGFRVWQSLEVGLLVGVHNLVKGFSDKFFFYFYVLMDASCNVIISEYSVGLCLHLNKIDEETLTLESYKLN